MATNLSLDPELLDKALRVSGEKTKKAAVTRALKEFVARHEQRNVRKLFGKLQWDDSYNYKKDRSRK
jgi:Arc/MetJ family transcription regulator